MITCVKSIVRNECGLLKHWQTLTLRLVVSAGTQTVMALPIATILGLTMTNDLFVVMNCSEVVDDHVNHDQLRIVVNMTRIVVGCNICLR